MKIYKITMEKIIIFIHCIKIKIKMSSSPWLQHVKLFRQANPHLSYKECLIHSKDSYQKKSGAGMMSSAMSGMAKAKAMSKKAAALAQANSALLGSIDPRLQKMALKGASAIDQANAMTGGGFDFAGAGKKAKAAAKKASKLAKDNANLLGQIDPRLQQYALTGANALDQANALTGGKFNVNNAMRKAQHTAQKAKGISKVAAKGLHEAGMVASFIDPRVGLAMNGLASGIDQANAMTGGSFKSGAGSNRYLSGGSFRSGSGMATHSSLVSPMHPSFKPLNPKSIYDRQHMN